MDFDEQDFANTLQAMAKTSKLLPEIFDLLCRAAAAKVTDSDEQDFANTLRAMAKTSRPPARDPRRAGLRRAELRQHAAGHGRDEQAPARDLRLPAPRRGGGAALVAASTLRRSKSGRVVLAGAARAQCAHPYKLSPH